MDKNIKAVFDDVCSDLVIDAKLIKRIVDYKTRFINRNPDHIAFFGGNLTGVQVVRFTTADRNEWFTNILECDELDLEDRLHSLKSVNPEFQVSSDVMNLSCLWLIYAIGRNAKLPQKSKEEGQLTTAIILNIKLLTSLLYRYFKYPANEETARATYAELNYKFSIKQDGSWNKVLENRGRDIIDPRGIHGSVFRTFDNDEKIIYLINDVQGRLRSMLKNIYNVFMQVHQSDNRIRSTSSIIEHDGVEALKDKTKSLDLYTRYIKSIITDKSSFMKEDLMLVIEKLMHTMPPKLFRQTLEWLSDAYGSKHTDKINESITELMVHAFDYLNANRVLMKNTTDMTNLITKLKGTYMSSRNTDPNLKKIRSDFEDLAKHATQNKNSSILSSIRTGVMLYIVVRAVSMKHYTNNNL